MRKIITEAKEDWLYMQLHMFKQGLIDVKHISDDLISEFRDNGIIALRFENNSEYFNLFGFSEYNVRILENLFSHYGSNYEWFDSYSASNEWREGYMYNYFNNENKELLNEIKEYLSPELDLNENDDVTKFCILLEETFHNIIDNITSDYAGEMNSAIEETFKEEVKNDLCDVFMLDGIYKAGSGCFYKYYTTVDTLIKIYDNFNDKTSNIHDILKKLGEDKNLMDNDYNDWYEYNYQDKFDDKSFNRSVTYNLEKIKDLLLDSDKFKDIDEYRKIKETLTNKFQFGHWFGLPKNKTIMFKIIGVDLSTNNVLFEYKKKGTQDFKNGTLPLERFNLFLYHPELF